MRLHASTIILCPYNENIMGHIIWWPLLSVGHPIMHFTFSNTKSNQPTNQPTNQPQTISILFTNFNSLWWSDAIDLDQHWFSLVRFCGIHLRANLQREPKLQFCVTSLKSMLLRLLPHLQGPNQLNIILLLETHDLCFITCVSYHVWIWINVSLLLTYSICDTGI